MPLTDPYSAYTQNTSILKPLSPCILKRTFISIYYKKIYTEQAMYLLELHIACTKGESLIAYRNKDLFKSSRSICHYYCMIKSSWHPNVGFQKLYSKQIAKHYTVDQNVRRDMVFLSMKYQIKNRKTKQNTLHGHADYLQNWVNQSVCLFLMIDNGSGKPKLVLLSKFVLP